MTAEEETLQSTEYDETMATPGAPTPVAQLEGTAGLTKRDIQLLVDGGFYTIESIAYTYEL